MRTLTRRAALALTCLGALAGGCAAVPARDAGPADPVRETGAAAAEDPLGAVGESLAATGGASAVDDTVVSDAFDATRVGGAPTGAALRYRRGDGSVATVRAGAPYAAASGRTCRPLLDVDGAPTGRVLCATGGDAWALVPRLGARDGSVPDDGPGDGPGDGPVGG